MKLQQLIRRYKNQTHQTNEQLAKQFHVSENTVSRWLRGLFPFPGSGWKQYRFFLH